MSSRCQIAAIAVSLTLVLAGCARTARQGAMTPDAGPEATTQPEPAYLAAAEAFATALEQGQPAQAHEMLTEHARKTLPAEQFSADMSDIGATGHRVVAQAATEDAAWVLAKFDSAASAAPESAGIPGLGMLLRKVGESWQVSFFMPTSDTGEGMNDLALTKSGEGEYTVNWTGPEGAPRSLTMTEF